MRIYADHKFGQMLDMAVLDLRQYRTPPEAASDVDIARSILGAEQETWLDETLKASTAKWTIVAQQTLISERDLADGDAERFSNDTWDGYRASRRKVLSGIEASNIANPLVIGGDLHAYFAADVKMDFADEAAPTLATEFVTGSISSNGPTDAAIATITAENPHIKYANGRDHGYAMVELSSSQAKVDFMVVSDRKDPNGTTSIAQSFVVADGMPGVVRG
jgi:alkaline phosphatase D